MKPFKLLVALTVIVVLLFLFSWIILHPALISRFDFTDPRVANIATAISGFSAPILTLFSAYLLYLALTKQTESNEVQKLKNDVDIIFLLYSQLDTEFNQLTYTVNGIRTTGQLRERYRDEHVGYDALFEFSSHARTFADTFHINKYTDKIKSILNSYLLIQKMLTVITLDKEFRSILTDKIDSFYSIKLRDSLKMLCFNIRGNNDEESRYVIDFVVRQEKRLGVDFDIHSYKNIEDVFLAR